MDGGSNPKSVIKIVVAAFPVSVSPVSATVPAKVACFVTSRIRRLPMIRTGMARPSRLATGRPSIAVAVKAAVGYFADSSHRFRISDRGGGCRR